MQALKLGAWGWGWVQPSKTRNPDPPNDKLIHQRAGAGGSEEEQVLMTMSTLNEEGVMAVKQVGGRCMFWGLDDGNSSAGVRGVRGAAGAGHVWRKRPRGVARRTLSLPHMHPCFSPLSHAHVPVFMQAACDRLLNHRVEVKVAGKRINDVLNRIHVAQVR